MSDTAQFLVTNPRLADAIKALEDADFIVYKKNAGRAVAVPPKKIHPLDLAELYDKVMSSVLVYKRNADSDDFISSKLIEIDGVWYEQDVTAPRTGNKYR